MQSIFLLVLLLALCTAAPVDKHEHGEKVAENVPADNHEENSSAKDEVDEIEKVEGGIPTDGLQREEKFFSHNEFELGDIGVSGTAEGGSISIGHQIEIDVHGLTHSHAVHGGYTEWSAWSDCSESCVRGHGHGHGTKKRSRTCTNPQPEYDGLTCEEQNLGPATETKECYVGPCPVNGGYTAWSEYGDCSVSCGDGIKIRSRACTKPEPQHDGLTCEDQMLGPATETKECNLRPCPVNGGYTAWSEYGACGTTCGDGIETRSRTCTSPKPQHGGLTCEEQKLGPATETKECNLRPCPVNGGYTAWSAYGACGTTCGDGIETRSRTCTDPKPQHGGLTCEEQKLGPAIETKECNLRPCPVNGGYTEWGTYGICSKSCGDGIKKRSRTCTMPIPQHGGQTCEEQSLGPAEETKECNLRPCPVNGGYTAWSEYGDCSVSCGDGIQLRSRTCTNPETKHGGLTCEENLGPDTEFKECNPGRCPDCSCSDVVKAGGFGNCEKEFDSMGFICWVNMPSTCSDIQENSMDPGNFYSAEACKSAELAFPDNKCFQESSGVMMHNVGYNHMEPFGPADWVVSSEGAKVSVLTTTRPSLGTTDLGHTEGEEGIAVRFTGQIVTTDDTDGHVMGMVFGYRSNVDFFVVASSGGKSAGGFEDTHPATNWYVARVHMTCGAKCTESKATSNAIWNPVIHPNEITVLKEGTANWKPNTRYTFAIDFDPKNLQLDVTVTGDGVNVLSTEGMISASVTDKIRTEVVDADDVDAESRKGGYIGLYVDAQKDTHWEELECRELHEKVGFEACVDDWCLQDGTDEQYTRCEAATDGGDTCINPLIKYGTTEGGIPIDDPMDYNAYCKMIFHEERIGSVTSGERDCSAAKGYVYWCTGGDEDGYKWCDYEGDGKWKDGSLDDLVDSDDCSAITSYSCKTGDL